MTIAFDPRILPAMLQRAFEANAPKPAKLMAARGMIPAAPLDTVHLLFGLSLDPDHELGRTATSTLQGLPQEIVQEALRQDVLPGALHFVAHQRNELPLLTLVAQHRGALTETLVFLAKQGPRDLTDILAINETRLLQAPEIIEALYLNPQTRMSVVDRLIELAQRNGVVFPHLDELNALVAGHDHHFHDVAPDEEMEALDFDVYMAETLQEEEDEARRKAEGSGKSEEDEGRKASGNRQSQIDAMSLAQKMRLGTLGSVGDRDYLIRNQNRLVHMAAVTSPKVQYNDIYAWSANKSLPEGVITYIAGHREYRRSYPIMVNLVNNPKTPMKEALRICQALQPGDLKAVAKNRNVNPQVARFAKSLLDAREKARR